MTLSLYSGVVTSLSVESRMVPVEIFMRTDAENARGHDIDAVVGMVGALADADFTQSSPLVRIEWVRLNMAGGTFAGMLAGCPFQVGDEVQVVAEDDNLLAIARPSDRMIALRPHCVRGCRAYFFRARKRWVVLSLLVLCFGFGILGILNETSGASWGWVCGIALGFGQIWAFIEYRYFLDNVRMASCLTEDILSTLGLPKSSDIDLNKTAKSQGCASDPPGYGWNFYRY